MKVAYIGSCFSEQFVNHVLGESELVTRYFIINTISLMDDIIVELPAIESLSPAFQRHVRYENRKDFKKRITSTNPDVLVVDYVRDVRCPICKFKNGYLSFPYELWDESDAGRSKFLDDVDLIHFGSQAYADLLISKLDEFCDFINNALPNTTVLFIDFIPSPHYRGVEWTPEQFRNDYIAWSLRLPIIRDLAHLSARKIVKAKKLQYNGTTFCSDDAAYGPSSIHYAPEVWAEMDRIFDRSSLSFPQFPLTDAPELQSVAKRSLLWLSDINKEVDRFSAELVNNGSDILTDIIPVLMNRAVYGLSFERKPTVVDAFFAFYWILGRVPESLSTLLSHSSERTLNSLRNRLIKSQEFMNYMRQIGYEVVDAAKLRDMFMTPLIGEKTGPIDKAQRTDGESER
jgi:hypothetical protein